MDVYVGQQMDVYLQAAVAPQAGHFEIGNRETPLPFEERGVRSREDKSPAASRSDRSLGNRDEVQGHDE